MSSITLLHFPRYRKYSEGWDWSLTPMHPSPHLPLPFCLAFPSGDADYPILPACVGSLGDVSTNEELQPEETELLLTQGLPQALVTPSDYLFLLATRRQLKPKNRVPSCTELTPSSISQTSVTQEMTSNFAISLNHLDCYLLNIIFKSTHFIYIKYCKQ